MRTLKSTVSLIVITLIIGSAYSTTLAKGEGTPGAAELFEAKCSKCHVTERAKNKRKTEKGWRNTVKRMMKINGCPITDEEAEIIIKHLSKEYGK